MQSAPHSPSRLYVACLLFGTLPWTLNPWVHPGVRFEKQEFLNAYGAVLCSVLPLAVLSGWLGGTLGIRLRGRSEAR
jgi:hypothetical protein